MKNPYHVDPVNLMMYEYGEHDWHMTNKMIVTFDNAYPQFREFREKVRMSGSRRHATIDTLIDRNAAVARITFRGNEATGSSKREPGDVFDADLGERFAIARALINLGYAIEDDANAEVKERCDAAES